MKGILFKPWKIIYIAEHPDIEIQTRRLGGLKGINHFPDEWILKQLLPNGKFWFKRQDKDGVYLYTKEVKPRYQVGETVYIKEAWGEVGWIEGDVVIHKLTDREGTIHAIIYPDENPDFEWRDDDGGIAYRKDGYAKSSWKSPLFMPERAARYFIVITGIGAGRLQEITEADAILEGFRTLPGMTSGGSVGLMSAVACFREVWDSINKDYPWESNPWVFDYTFRLKEGK